MAAYKQFSFYFLLGQIINAESEWEIPSGPSDGYDHAEVAAVLNAPADYDSSQNRWDCVQPERI
ncbi:unnamed protein product [Penicillium glandicola]